MKIILNIQQYKYLRINGILEQYKANVKNYRDEDGDLNYSYSDEFINDSFTWSETPEGRNFWQDHNLKSMYLEANDIYTLEL